MNDETSPAAFWEARYAESEGVWSGRVNGTMADVVGELAPGTALDLGCGEGGDAIWLAQQGWTVTGVDIAPTAVGRARRAAQATGLAVGSVTFVAADLAEWSTAARYDLVSASFLQSWPVVIPREQILRRAATFVAPRGHLLVLAHAAAPPWADAHVADSYRFPTPEADLAALALDPDHWEVVRAELRARPVTSPGHGHADVLDGLVLARRLT